MSNLFSGHCPICSADLGFCEHTAPTEDDIDHPKNHPAEFRPHASGDGRRFHCRMLNGSFQVYGLGLHHICMTDTLTYGEMVADALELTAGATRKSPTEIA